MSCFSRAIEFIEENAKSRQHYVIDSLPIINKDWSFLQEEAYDECMSKILNDDSPVTAFIEWLQKKYPGGAIINCRW